FITLVSYKVILQIKSKNQRTFCIYCFYCTFKRLNIFKRITTRGILLMKSLCRVFRGSNDTEGAFLKPGDASRRLLLSRDLIFRADQPLAGKKIITNKIMQLKYLYFQLISRKTVLNFAQHLSRNYDNISLAD
ncbi:MAG: hypothetical protein KAZ36_02265, partial [Bacteroidales bacterium]|nr:hypothetical protein [Bacteroidales bacterium]